MSADRADEARTQVRVAVAGTGAANVATGVSVLDHLLRLLAEYGSFDVALEVAPGQAEAEVRAAGRAFGEALAHVALEASDQPLLASNVDLTGARLGGMGTDLVAAFLQEFVEGASLTLHVRLIDGSDTHHVLEAIFKALGVTLAQALRPRRQKE